MTPHLFFFFFFNDTATTEIYTLSLHDALPISLRSQSSGNDDFSGLRTYQLSDSPRHVAWKAVARSDDMLTKQFTDRKSTRLNSSHLVISYAVFCLKKKKNNYHVCIIYLASHTR